MTSSLLDCFFDETISQRPFILETFKQKGNGKLVNPRALTFKIQFLTDGRILGAEEAGIFYWTVDSEGLHLKDNGKITQRLLPTVNSTKNLLRISDFQSALPEDNSTQVREVVRASRLLTSIPSTIEFSGEFGEEVNSFIPYIYWLERSGEMHSRSILTFKGMEPFYYFLHPSQIQTKTVPREGIHAKHIPPYIRQASGLHSRGKLGMEWSPPYRDVFRDKISFEKPILVVHNKYSMEWGLDPINFINTETLDIIFEKYKDKYQIIFFEAARSTARTHGYSADHQQLLEYNDYEIARSHPEVIIFGDFLQRTRGNYNDLKLKIFSNTYHFITTQGGNAHMSALFPGSVVIILHIKGSESLGSYTKGIFQHLTEHTPHYLIAGDNPSLLNACEALSDSELINGRVLLGPKGIEMYKAHNPWTWNTSR